MKIIIGSHLTIAAKLSSDWGPPLTDLIDWYEGQLEKLQVTVRLNNPMEADEVEAFGADVVIIATGSLPTETGFQKQLPHLDRLPGIARGKVWSVEDVMSRVARPGKRVLLLDDTGHWRGAGTAWHLAEQGHAVTLVTPDPMAGAELVRTSADWALRQRLAALGVVTLADSAVSEWHGDGATVVNLLDNSTRRVESDALVLATINVAETGLLDALAEGDLEVHGIGDCIAPRRANNAIFEGRRLGLKL